VEQDRLDGEERRGRGEDGEHSPEPRVVHQVGLGRDRRMRDRGGREAGQCDVRR
jgi:hypothetical protein